MRFIVDECTGPTVGEWLRKQGHEVYSIYDDARGADDDSIIKKAFNENYILITNDKDFGELVFRKSRPHKGIIFLRLIDERSLNKINILEKLLKLHAEVIENNFVIVTEETIRVIEQ